MSNTETGGPAFPVGTAFQGLTMRDYFAAKAMQGFISQADSAMWTAEEIASDAYLHADAMLEARK